MATIDITCSLPAPTLAQVRAWLTRMGWQRYERVVRDGGPDMRWKRDLIATAIRAIRAQRKAIDAFPAQSAIVDDLRALVAEADRPRGGMQAPWFHELANALQLPSVVRWARRHVKAVGS